MVREYFDLSRKRTDAKAPAQGAVSSIVARTNGATMNDRCPAARCALIPGGSTHLEPLDDRA